MRSRPKFSRALLRWLLLAGWLAACGPGHGDAWVLAMAAGSRALTAGRHAEAATHYAEAAAKAKRVKDRDEAMFLQARMLRRLGKDAEAAAVYRRLVKLSPKGPRTARAVYELSHITIAAGKVEAGYAELVAAIERYPNHGSTRLAVASVIRHYREGGKDRELAALLERWIVRLRGSDIEQRAKYELALARERAGDKHAALTALLKAAREHPYPKGSLTDDALWRASELAEELGDLARAVAILRELLSSREEAQGGSYERPRFPPAQMRIAELYLKMGKLGDARRELEVMRTRHKTSILADDAMWLEAVVSTRLGDPAGACRLAESLPREFPDSRFARCLQLVCPAAKPAKRACPDYIKRSLEPVTP